MCACPAAFISGYVKLPENDHDALMTAIATVGPIAITVEADVWMDYENGVFDGPSFGCKAAQEEYGGMREIVCCDPVVFSHS